MAWDYVFRRVRRYKYFIAVIIFFFLVRSHVGPLKDQTAHQISGFSPTTEEEHANDATVTPHEEKETHKRKPIKADDPEAGRVELLTSGKGSGRNDKAGFIVDAAYYEPFSRTVKYPLSPEEITPLPKKDPLSRLPPIQAARSAFKETDDDKKIRINRLDAVKAAFAHTWKGYKKHAWGHDELMPLTLKFSDPFTGWAATLVDSIDTLQIMGLDQEVKEVTDFLKDLDFSKSKRSDIPLFETTIRYLGGLLAAYDLSIGKNKIFLDKAVELAENLLGAFDTPNHMPLTYFYWSPRVYKEKYRAGVSAVMSEVASLSVEFTRLAQITGRNEFFDAVQRITDALDEYAPKTHIPGLFPMELDISGCALYETHSGADANQDQHKQTTKASPKIPNIQTHETESQEVIDKKDEIEIPEEKASSINKESAFDNPNAEKNEVADILEKDAGLDHDDEALANALKNSAAGDGTSNADAAANKLSNNADEVSDHHGRLNKRASTVKRGDNMVYIPGDIFGIAKYAICKPQGIVAGRGAEEVYGMGGCADSTYEYFLKEYVLLEGASNVYRRLYLNSADQAKKFIFYRPKVEGDPDILFAGRSIYNSATENITFDPEHSHLACFAGGMMAIGGKVFNRPEDITIGEKLTEGCFWAYQHTKTGIMPEVFHVEPCDRTSKTCHWEPPVKSTLPSETPKIAAVEQVTEGQKFQKRAQIDDFLDAESKLPSQNFKPEKEAAKDGGNNEDQLLPTSFLDMDGSYMLRPEAFESLFILYRVTGAKKWQDEAWKMFQAVEKYCRTPTAYAGIENVMSKKPAQKDSMESFWPAESLKYLYLTFSDPGLVSLDDYVFNTEAHPLRRSKE